MTQTNATSAPLSSCCRTSPTAFTISIELNEIGGSLHRTPVILEVDGRRLSPLHDSRRVGKRARLCSELGRGRQVRSEVPPSLSSESRPSILQLPQGKATHKQFSSALCRSKRFLPSPLRKVAQTSVKLFPYHRPSGRMFLSASCWKA